MTTLTNVEEKYVKNVYENIAEDLVIVDYINGNGLQIFLKILTKIVWFMILVAEMEEI